MSWILLGALILGLNVTLFGVLVRRAELRRLQRGLAEIATARESGSDKAQLQYPDVDLSRCIGCGVCVAVCPEEGVLEIVHGQALVVHGARCVGHGLCARECPVGAIAVTLGDLSERKDIPALTENFESPTSPGLFLAGEVTGFALIRTAVEHGTAVANEVVSRLAREPRNDCKDVFDLCIVGAGPAGLACSLQAKAHGLSFVTLEQEAMGGTVARYPRRKLVMTQPIDLPLFGRLKRATYTKEELMELWERIAREHELPIHTGQTLQRVERTSSGLYRVHTALGVVEARYVCLALGRRGTPIKLGVPGEDLPKVAYSLLDAQSYQERRILVVGGGDSAIEAAVGLSEQPGNQVSLAYRKPAFFRIKARNQDNVTRAVAAGRLNVLFESQVTRIEQDRVELVRGQGDQGQLFDLPNDEVFVMAGGTPPFQLLEASGISFEARDRPAVDPEESGRAALLRSLLIATVIALFALGWLAFFSDYYTEPSPAARAAHAWHAFLRPSRGAGLAFGITSATLIVLNLVYLLRRAKWFPFVLGSLRSWMTAHVASGLLALVAACLHAAMAPRSTTGGGALAALAVLVLTGTIGRFFYAFVPRAANGNELAIDQVQRRLAGLSAKWDGEHRVFGETVRARVQALVDAGRWRTSFFARVASLVRGQRELRSALTELRAEGRREGIPETQLRRLLGLARRAHGTAMMAAHFEDLRALLASWRFLHRWIALLMTLLLAQHIASALRYGDIFSGGSG